MIMVGTTIFPKLEGARIVSLKWMYLVYGDDKGVYRRLRFQPPLDPQVKNYAQPKLNQSLSSGMQFLQIIL